jgi:hypothetical protein
MHTFCRFILLLFLNIPSFAQLSSPFWKQSSTLSQLEPGNGISSLAIHSGTNKIFVGTSQGDVFMSDDGSVNWQQVLDIKETAINKIAIHPNGSIFVLGANCIYVSNDSGLLWMRVEIPTSYELTDIVFSRSSIFVSSASIIKNTSGQFEFYGDGVFASNDGGKTWLPKNFGIHYRKSITQLAISKDEVLFAAMASNDGLGGGLYYSTDIGNTWYRLNNIQYKVSTETYSIHSLYQVLCLEVDVDDTVHFSYEGSGGNFAMSGNLKINVEDLIWGKLWQSERVVNSGYDWDNKPYYTYMITRNKHHRYASLHTPHSTIFGGPYFMKIDSPQWMRVPSGMLPIGYSYLQTFFAEDNKGRVYATQQGDNKLFFTDTSAFIVTSNKLLFDKNALHLYPNPVVDYLRITTEFEIKKIDIFNSKAEWCQTNLYYNQFDIILDLQQLSTGFYLIRIQTEKGTITQKIIKTQ